MDDEWMIRHKHKNTDTDTRPLLRHATSQERSVDGKRLGKERIKIVSPASCQLLVWPQQPRGALAFGKQARTTCKGQGTGTGDRENIEERLTKIRNGRCVRQADLEGGLSGCNCSLYTQVCCDFRSNRPRKTSHDIPTTQRRTAWSHPSVTLVTPVALPYPRRSSPTPGASTKRADSSTGQDATHGS